MKTVLLTGLLLAFLPHAGLLAQQPATPSAPPARPPQKPGQQLIPPDRILLKDQRVVRCYIVDVNTTEIRYRLSASPDSPIIRLSQTQVLRVERQQSPASTPSPMTPGTLNAKIAQALTPLESTAQQSDNPMRQILDSLRARNSIGGLRIKLKDLNFETNSADLIPASKTYLDTIASALNKFPALVLEIGGHTDNVGRAVENQTLSERRAQTVRDYLVTPGRVTAKRLTARGYGQTRPVATNTLETNRQKNRRVEMLFVGLDVTLVNRIYRSSGEIITAPLVFVDDRNQSVLYKTSENAPLVELNCAEVTKIVYADGREQAINCRDKPVAPVTNLQPRFSSHKDSKFNLKLMGGAGYMITPAAWTDKTNGYAHVLGFGGMALITYKLSKNIGVALEPGYWKFSTQVDYKASDNGTILKQYNSKATQLSLFLALPLYINENIYLMPEGGINMLKIEAGFDGKNDSYSGLQPGFGGALGYTSDRTKAIQFDLGLFYRAGLQNSSWQQQYGVPMMHYAGIRAGLGFSL